MAPYFRIVRSRLAVAVIVFVAHKNAHDAAFAISLLQTLSVLLPLFARVCMRRMCGTRPRAATADQRTRSAAPLPTPAITGPLQAAPPNTFDAGPFGKISVNGIVSGMGLWQGNHVAGDEPTQAALSNGQIFIQKTTGWWQFYVQAGAYNIPAPGDAVPRHRQSH